MCRNINQLTILSLAFSLLGLSSYGYASPVSDNFSSQEQYAKDAYSNVGNAVNGFNPAAEFSNYNDNPQQTQYYNNPGAIGDDSIAAESTDTAGNAIGTSMASRPVYQINTNSPDIQRSILLEKDAYNITHGISDQYINCQQQQNCHTTYTNESCKSSSQSTISCYITPVVEIVDVPYQETVQYSGSVTPTSSTTGTISLPDDGTVTAMSATFHTGNQYRCHETYYGALNGATLPGTTNGQCGKKLDRVSFSGSNLSIPVTKDTPNQFKFWGGEVYSNWDSSSYSITMSVTRYKREAQVTYQNSCATIPSQCTPTDNKCIDPGETRMFDDIPVTQDCWKKQQNYSCGVADDHSCDALKSKGCSELNSQCSLSIGGICLEYNVTYQCGQTTCDGGTSNICGDGYFCMDGQCYEPKPEQDSNFGKDDSEIASAAGAADAIAGNQDALLAFTGQAASCSEAPIGFLTCCADSGWGKEVGLSSCSDEEKQLGLAKQKGYTVYVGEYCANSVLGVCTSSRKAYCMFDGYMALDVQYQGRYQQLGIGFGDPKSPNCSGITIDQLQNIDFSKIDFSNLVQQMNNQTNFPDPNDIKNRIEQDIEHRMNP